MASTYLLLASIAQQAGVLVFMTAFALVLIYALRPSSRARFDAAARMPLQED